MNAKKLEHIAMLRRLDVLEVVNNAKTGHIGGSMSCMDILTCLYYHIMNTDKIFKGDPERDRFILSKGHCAEALYVILADKNFITKDDLMTYAAFDTALAEHPTKKVKGVEAATGALGHGLSIGVGMAIGLKADNINANVYVLMGDGEQAEGSIWEAALSASKYKLGNLTAVIDRNRLQISGNTEDVMPLGDLAEKYRSFGWECRTCDGHNPSTIIRALTENRSRNKPLAVIAETIKGFGSPVMADKADWHHLVPTAEQYIQIKSDLSAAAKLAGEGE